MVNSYRLFRSLCLYLHGLNSFFYYPNHEEEDNKLSDTSVNIHQSTQHHIADNLCHYWSLLVPTNTNIF